LFVGVRSFCCNFVSCLLFSTMVFTCNWMDFLQVYTAILEYVGHPKCILLVKKPAPVIRKSSLLGYLLLLGIKECPLSRNCVCVYAATPAFDIRSSGLFCGQPGSLELVTRLPARSVMCSFDSFHWGLKTFLFWFYQHTQLIRGFAVMHYINLLLTGWLGSRVVSVLDSGAEGPGFKSQPRCCRVTF